MIKKLLLLIAVLVLTQTLSSQVVVGVKGGVNYVNFSGNTAEVNSSLYNRTYRLGYHFGFYGKLPLGHRFSARTELLYSEKGYKTETTGKESLHIHYLNLPLLLEFELVKKLTLLAGPEFGCLLFANYKTDSATIFISKKKWINRFDFEVAAGASYMLSDKITLEARFTQGITPATDPYSGFTDHFASPLENLAFWNRAFQLSLAYRLREF